MRVDRPRATKPDVDDPQRGYYGVIKNVSSLRLTYQIRLLGYMAEKNERFLFIKVPKTCVISPKLAAWAESLVTRDGQKRVRIQRY